MTTTPTNNNSFPVQRNNEVTTDQNSLNTATLAVDGTPSGPTGTQVAGIVNEGFNLEALLRRKTYLGFFRVSVDDEAGSSLFTCRFPNMYNCDGTDWNGITPSYGPLASNPYFRGKSSALSQLNDNDAAQSIAPWAFIPTMGYYFSGQPELQFQIIAPDVAEHRLRVRFEPFKSQGDGSNRATSKDSRRVQTAVTMNLQDGRNFIVNPVNYNVTSVRPTHALMSYDAIASGKYPYKTVYPIEHSQQRDMGYIVVSPEWKWVRPEIYPKKYIVKVFAGLRDLKIYQPSTLGSFSSVFTHTSVGAFVQNPKFNTPFGTLGVQP
nr:MAG: hypothetical protein [Wufeng shrew picorna-like virus 52]